MVHPAQFTLGFCLLAALFAGGATAYTAVVDDGPPAGVRQAAAQCTGGSNTP